MNRNTFTKEKIIREYVAWLYENYPEVVKMKSFEALDNEEKANLEESCEGVGNQFFEWFELKYPSIWRINLKQKQILLNIYRNEIGDNEL